MLERNELDKIIDQIPPNKLNDLIQYAKQLAEKGDTVPTEEFEHYYKMATRKHDKTLENLVER